MGIFEQLIFVYLLLNFSVVIPKHPHLIPGFHTMTQDCL